MKTTFYFLLASLFLLPLRLSGQCNVAIPANAIFVAGNPMEPQDTFVDVNGDPIWTCFGATVFTQFPFGVNGNRDFFLEEGTSLNVLPIFGGSLTVWLKDGASLTVAESSFNTVNVYYETLTDIFPNDPLPIPLAKQFGKNRIFWRGLQTKQKRLRAPQSASAQQETIAPTVS
jgi:hypothetical protein